MPGLNSVGCEECGSPWDGAHAGDCRVANGMKKPHLQTIIEQYSAELDRGLTVVVDKAIAAATLGDLKREVAEGTRTVSKGVYSRLPGEVIMDLSGEVIHSQLDRPVANNERLERFLQASRGHRQEIPRANWAAANLAAEAVDTLRDDELALTNKVLGLHLATIRYLVFPTQYQHWEEAAELLRMSNPELLAVLLEYDGAKRRMENLLQSY